MLEDSVSIETRGCVDGEEEHPDNHRFFADTSFTLPVVLCGPSFLVHHRALGLPET